MKGSQNRSLSDPPKTTTGTSYQINILTALLHLNYEQEAPQAYMYAWLFLKILIGLHWMTK
jgi:hypothetical protein